MGRSSSKLQVNPPVSATKSESSDDEHKPTPEYNSPSGGQASQPIAIEVRRGSNQSNLTPFSVISMPLTDSPSYTDWVIVNLEVQKDVHERCIGNVEVYEAVPLTMHSMVISPSETGLNNYTDNTSRCIDEDETAQAPTSQDAENVAALMSSDNVITSTDLIKEQ